MFVTEFIDLVHDGRMKLESIDLNLLVALDAFLRERSVTAAGKRLGLSQSAASHALARLRALLSDPVLERGASGMVPTARARSLERPLRAILGQIEAVLEADATFQPAASRARFVLALDEGTQLGVLPALLHDLSKEAPSVQVHAVSTSRAAMLRGLESGEIDAAITVPPKLPRGYRAEPLSSFRYVVISRKGHPAIDGKLTLRRYLAEKHVVLTTAESVDLDVDRELAARGRARDVAASTSSAMALPAIVARTDYLATVPDLLVPMLRARGGLAMHPSPVSIAPVAVSLVWHVRSERDAPGRWIRSRIRGVFEGLCP